jgi:hypothetical protein
MLMQHCTINTTSGVHFPDDIRQFRWSARGRLGRSYRRARSYSNGNASAGEGDMAERNRSGGLSNAGQHMC